MSSPLATLLALLVLLLPAAGTSGGVLGFPDDCVGRCCGGESEPAPVVVEAAPCCECPLRAPPAPHPVPAKTSSSGGSDTTARPAPVASVLLTDPFDVATTRAAPEGLAVPGPALWLRHGVLLI